MRQNNPALRQIAAFQSETAALVAEPEPFSVRATLHLLAGALIAGLIAASQVHIDRVVTGTGQVVSQQPTEVVQSFDKAIVTSLDVREGDHVRAGQVLATLDPTFAKADLAQLQVKIESLDAEIARLQAEKAGQQPQASALPQRYAGIELALWQQRQDQYRQQLRGYDAKIAEAAATIAKYSTDTAQYSQRLAVMMQIEAMRAKLYQHRDESRMTFLQAQDQRLELQRNLAYERNAEIESRHALDQAEAEKQAYQEQWRAQIDSDLVQRQTQRDAALAQLAKANRRDDLVMLRAASDGVILQRAKLSVGAVLKEGTTLYTLIPDKAPLEADISIGARDIGFVRAGDPVTIKLGAFNYLEHGTADGRLTVISADSFTTGGDGSNRPTRPYYKGHVSIDRLEMHDLPQGFRLIPGMTVTADIRVGKRTLLAYLMQGALRNIDEAMREP